VVEAEVAPGIVAGSRQQAGRRDGCAWSQPAVAVLVRRQDASSAQSQSKQSYRRPPPPVELVVSGRRA